MNRLIYAEVLITLFLVQVGLWSFTLRPALFYIGPAWVTWVLYRRHIKTPKIVLTWANPKQGLWQAAVGVYLTVIGVWLCGIYMGSANWEQIPGLFPSRTWGYAPWGAFQEIIVQLVFALGLKQAGQKKYAIVFATAMTFALCHAPNGLLMAITLVGGLFTTWHFLKYQNLWIVCAGHAIIGLAIASYWPTKLFIVGAGYVSKYGLPFSHTTL